MHTLPFIDTKNNTTIPLLIVLPNPNKETISNGLVIPEGAGIECTTGIVEIAGKDSIFKKGDEITYRIIDRQRNDSFELYHADGKEFEILAENEVWAVNDEPFNRVFVQPLSNMAVIESILVIPDNVKGIPTKGRVVAAPANYFCKAGDIVDYRMNEKGRYYQAAYDRTLCDVIFEPDIYLINGETGPHRVIVRIDKSAQRLKQNARGQLALSPLFIGMLYNLQYGEVVGIGSEAAKYYPDMKVGDTAIFDHKVEEQKHRIVSQEIGTSGEVIFENRIIECFNPASREIFGCIKKVGKYKHSDVEIIPYGKCIFFEWGIEIFGGAEGSALDTDLSLNKCTDIEDLRNITQHQNASAAAYFKSKLAGYHADMEKWRYQPEKYSAEIERTGRNIDLLKIGARKMGDHVKKNHLVRCKVAFNNTQNPVPDFSDTICTYKELYAINILGKRYLIGHVDYIVSYLKNNDTMTLLQRSIPIGDQVLILPIADEKETVLVIPEDAREKPQLGRVISVGKDVDPGEIQEGYEVVYRKRVGTEITLEGVNYLMLKRNDVFLGTRP